MPSVDAKVDTEDRWFIAAIAEQVYLTRQEKYKKDGRSKDTDKATMNWAQYCAHHHDEAQEITNFCREVMSALLEKGVDLVLADQWLPRQTIIVSEPFSEERPIVKGPPQRSRRRR